MGGDPLAGYRVAVRSLLLRTAGPRPQLEELQLELRELRSRAGGA
jgi:hypothetical protein